MPQPYQALPTKSGSEDESHDGRRPASSPQEKYVYLRIAEMTHTELDSNVSGMWRNHNHAEMSQFSSLFFFWQVTLFVSLLIRWAIPLTLHDFRLWVDLTTTATTGFNPRVFLAPACRWQDSPRTAQSWEMQRPQVTETYWHMQLMLLRFRCYLFSSHPWQPEPPPTLSAPGACSCRGSTRCGRLRVFVPVHGHLVLATLGYPWQLVLKGSFLSLLLISCHLIFALASEMGETCSGCRARFYTRSETFSGHSWCFWRMLFRLQHWTVVVIYLFLFLGFELHLLRFPSDQRMHQI